MNEDEIINRVKSLYPDAIMELSGADCSFELYVVTDAFVGMTPIKRQQSILALFKEELTKGSLHALSIKAKTNSELAAQPGLVNIKL